MKSSPKKTTFIGAQHATGFGQIPKIFDLLGKEGMPSRVGVERLTQSFDPKDARNVDERFWKALRLNATRKRMNLIPLEENPAGKVMYSLNSILHSLLVLKKMPQGTDYLPHIERIIELAHPQDKKYEAIVQEFKRSFHTLTIRDAQQLYDAMSVYRSDLMRWQARHQNLSHSIVGASHAEDIENNKNTRTLYTITEKSAQKEIERRRTAFLRFKGFLKKLAAIAQAK